MIDKLEEKYGFKLKDLSVEEKETFFAMLSNVQKSELTLEKWRSYITSMKDAVAEELSKEPEYIKFFIFKFRNDKNILLKARLRNYILMEAFLLSPQRAEEQLENALAGMVKKF